MAQLLEEWRSLIADDGEKTNTGKEQGNATKPPLNKTRSKSDFDRASDFVAGLQDVPEDSCFKKGLGCFCRWGVKPLILVIMAYVWIFKQLYKVYKLLPINLINIIFGTGLCFFGGTYFAAIAAAEAALNLGGADMWRNLSILYEEAAAASQAHLDDDKVDANNDGIADVKQMSNSQLINHKAKVAMMAVKDPMRLQQAMFALGNVWIAVIATLKFQFARTVAVALGIANMLTVPVTQITAPLLVMIMGKDLAHWVPAMIDTTVKMIAVFCASWIQMFISAFYSGLRGGSIIAVSIFNILGEYGVMDRMPDCLVKKPFDPNTSFLDEVIQYPLAAVGFYFQVTRGFTLDFPWNLICLPLTIIEWVIRFQVYT